MQEAGNSNQKLQLVFKYIKKIISVVLLLVFIYIVLIPLIIILTTRDSIYEYGSVSPKYKVGIVFGAAVNANRQPSDMLRDRLDTALKLYNEKKIDIIIVSGDNSTKRYNEPQVMYEYLVNNGVSKENVIRDYAGLRTYDTCIRANTLWGVNKAILITQKYHLYRASYTCKNLGVENIGYSATIHNYVGDDVYKVREYFAIYKSYLDLNFLNPSYIGGKVEGDLSDN